MKVSKNKTLVILSCLVTSGVMGSELPNRSFPLVENEVLRAFVINQDDIFQEMKKRGIITELKGLPMPLVNYGILAKELKKAGQKNQDIIFVVKNVKEAIKLFSEEDVKNRNLTEILDQMGVLERRDYESKRGTICM